MYTIGELADISNVSVRTLRYFDEIGLLPPAQKNAAGHRYGDISMPHYNIGFLLEMLMEGNVIWKKGLFMTYSFTWLFPILFGIMVGNH
ncbi:MerR family DNA-binding transcriptional regulator [Sporosarcina sp. Te-1]|uniref:MerR family DNA-binding transcriptional regulator n=1 Tax=Sporosarcina sp. Te-1 TaxID=2818390 RepID=UPI001A9EC958|nr:MerR family DNA-binding transcriptional regulator [Sporosarcina sp. Te-1]